jgi:hypothetical protein
VQFKMKYPELSSKWSKSNSTQQKVFLDKLIVAQLVNVRIPRLFCNQTAYYFERCKTETSLSFKT